jgi:hypothetical protein
MQSKAGWGQRTEASAQAAGCGNGLGWPLAGCGGVRGIGQCLCRDRGASQIRRHDTKNPRLRGFRGHNRAKIPSTRFPPLASARNPIWPVLESLAANCWSPPIRRAVIVHLLSTAPSRPTNPLPLPARPGFQLAMPDRGQGLAEGCGSSDSPWTGDSTDVCHSTTVPVLQCCADGPP